MLERLAEDKHTSLLRKFINYDRKTFNNIGPQSSFTERKLLVRNAFLRSVKYTKRRGTNSNGFLFFQFLGIVGVQIREMRVPPVVESGKHPHVILDCDYDLTENEGRQARINSGKAKVVRDEFQL
jgi:hypothetical protein